MTRKPRHTLNVIGAQVKKLRLKEGLSQLRLAEKLQLSGWSVSRDSIASLEVQRRRVADLEVLFLAQALHVGVQELFPKNLDLKKVGAQFQSGERLAIFPTRSDK